MVVQTPRRAAVTTKRNTLTIEYTILSGNRQNTNLQDGFIRQVLSKIQQTISLLTSCHTSPRTSFKWY